MNREGEIFKNYIDNSDLTIDRVIAVTGISRGNLYSLFLKEKIADKWKEKIEKLGLNIDWSTKSTESKKENYADPGVMDRLSALKPKAEQNINEELEEAGTLIIRKEDLIRVLKTYQVIIDQAFNDGIIRFEKKKIKTT